MPTLPGLTLPSVATRTHADDRVSMAVEPLAIGLFGAWGAGKSHFMSLMQHVKDLAESRVAGGDPSEGA